MGYYSFYRIIKDIVSTIFGRKFWRYALIGIIIGLILLFLCNRGVFATTTLTADQNRAYTVYDSYVDYAFTLLNQSSSSYADTVIELVQQGYNVYVNPSYYTISSSYSTNFWNIDYTASTFRYIYFYFYKYSGSSMSFDVIDETTWSGVEDLSCISFSTSYNGWYTYCYRLNISGLGMAQLSLSSYYAPQMPYILYNYYPSTLADIADTSSDEQVDEILALLEEQLTEQQNTTTAVEENTEAIQSLQDALTSTEYDESVMNIDTSSTDDIDDTETVNFISSILTDINTAVTGDWDEVEEITIGIPFTDGSITLSSDLVSSNIPSAFYLLIQGFWMFLFGKYIWRFANNLIHWLKSGDILNNSENIGSDDTITTTML